MKIQNRVRRCAALLLAASLLLSLTACSGKDTTAAAMHLRRTEGTVSVSDGNGKDIPPLNNLGLYSGYGVGTRSASYAWIDLDDVKLTKLDQNSEIVVQKEGKALDIEVKSGSLFFSVTQPLEDDETLNIRASTMLVGIRGTSGWVSCGDDLSQVYILEGKVECSAEGRTVWVGAGEYAGLRPDGELAVEPFTAEDIPDFVREDLLEVPGLSGTPGPAAESEEVVASGQTEDLTWELRGNTLTISGTGNMKNYGSYGGSNGAPWYSSRAQIHTIVIKDGVTGIGSNAFEDCGQLKDITISDSVTVIGDAAFYHCSSLERVTIPGSVQRIGKNAFGKCTGLTGVTMLDGVTGIGRDAFNGCENLAGVTIPDSVTGIEDYAFSGCQALKSVIIPSSVTNLGVWAFSYCGSMTSVTILDGVPYIPADAFYGCSSLESVTIPSSVTSIGTLAFFDCSSLTDVYYGGSESQWGEISFGPGNDKLLNAAIYCSS